MRRPLSTFLHILALDTKPVAPPQAACAIAEGADVDALLDLALVMRERWEGTALAGPGYESHRLVAAALARIFPGDVETFERCTAAECHLNGCDECATEAQLAAADAELTAFLAAIPRPRLLITVAQATEAAEGLAYLARAAEREAK